MMRTNKKSGWTLIELMVSVAIISIAILAVGGAMADSFRAWGKIYDSMNADIVTQSYAVTRSFEKRIRESTNSIISMDTATSPAWVDVFYALPGTPTVLDQHAKFSYNSTTKKLYLEQGTVGATTAPGAVLCDNVTSCVFKRTGAAVRMILTITSGNRTAEVVSSAVLHNNI